MRKTGTGLLIAISMAAALLTGCGREEKVTEPKSFRVPLEKIPAAEERTVHDWIMPQSDRVLKIGVTDPIDIHLNPFTELSPSGQEVLSLIYTCPMRSDGTPWAGNIETRENGDGSLTATVSCRKNMVFSDGEPIMIDDWIYGFYVAADPSMTNPLLEEMTGIEGMNEFRFNEPRWEDMKEKAEKKAAAFCSISAISQEDFALYMTESRMEGLFDTKTMDEWQDYAVEEGFGYDWSLIDADNDEEVLSLLSLIEFSNHPEKWEPEEWWVGKIMMDEMMDSLGSDGDIEEISGIRKIDDWTCEVTFPDKEDYSFETLNKPFIPIHMYGHFRKGDLTDVLSVDMPLGSGPYRIKSLTPERVRLEANHLYFEGMPIIGSIEFLHIEEGDDANIDMLPSPTERSVIEKLFTEESLAQCLPEGTYYESVLWQLRLR